MHNFEVIKQFFQNLKCSQCNEFYSEDSVKLIRKEENNVVVRVCCVICGKNLGLAILGLDSEEYNNSLNFQESGQNKLLQEKSQNPEKILPPITYDEVAQAHKFFSSLDSDWMKYLRE